jgi:chemosensory pili system protein ChpA (sensor histidine kinase/response regulator)
MSTEKHDMPVLLIVEADDGLRGGLKDLLTRDGYRIATAKDDQDAVNTARRQPPDLILVCLSEPPPDLISAIVRIRERAEINNEVPIVVFASKQLPKGRKWLTRIMSMSSVLITSTT